MMFLEKIKNRHKDIAIFPLIGSDSPTPYTPSSNPLENSDSGSHYQFLICLW